MTSTTFHLSIAKWATVRFGSKFHGFIEEKEFQVLMEFEQNKRQMLIISGAETILKVGGVFLDFCPFFRNLKKWGVCLKTVGFRESRSSILITSYHVAVNC